MSGEVPTTLSTATGLSTLYVILFVYAHMGKNSDDLRQHSRQQPVHCFAGRVCSRCTASDCVRSSLLIRFFSI
jgi:hypothetical protein